MKLREALEMEKDNVLRFAKTIITKFDIVFII